MATSKSFQKAWVAVGDVANWERGLENGIWGIVPELQHHWERLAPNDLILFYCKAPVSRFFGTGIARGKFKQTEPLWKEELQEKRVIWPYRFEFDPVHLIPLQRWMKDGIPNRSFGLALQGGLNPVADFSKALQLQETLNARVTIPQIAQRQVLAERIREIGQIQRMVVESSYPVDDYTLDVIWKRTIRSVPTFVFKIGVEAASNDSFPALKCAYELWNSRPFLVTESANLGKAREASTSLPGDFRSALKILDNKVVDELYTAKKNYYSLEEKWGLR